MTEHAEDIRKHVRVYLLVFAALGVLTVVTVAASYLKVSVGLAVLIALLIASVKGSLVACYFMHLISEKKLIYWILGFTVVFLVAMMVLIVGANKDQQGELLPADAPPAPGGGHHVS